MASATGRCGLMQRSNPGLLDHLVGAQQNRWSYRKAERFRGPDVDLLRILIRLCSWSIFPETLFRIMLSGSLPEITTSSQVSCVA
jgi:hypothetical protein